MAFNINDFISVMKRDGYRPNLFEITLTLPTIVSSQQFTLKAKATAIPSSSVGTASLFYFGRQAKFAGNRSFDNWTVSVIMDETDFIGFGTRGMFEQWSSLINSHQGNIRNSGYVSPSVGGGGYYGTGTITPLGKDGSALGTTYLMQGCYPIDVGSLPLDWGDNDRIAEFPVTFAYQWWGSAATLI
mgnify:CR=1 FL=1